MEIDYEGINSNKDIYSDSDLVVKGKSQDDVDGLIASIRNQPMQDKKDFLELILRPEIDKKQRIIETLIQESGNPFLIKNIRCLKRLYKYGTNQLLGLGVDILFSDVTQDRNNLKMLTNVLENLTKNVNKNGPTARIKPEDIDQEEEAEIEIMENLTNMNRARFSNNIPHILQDGTGFHAQLREGVVHAGAGRRREDFNQFYNDRYHQHGSRPLALLSHPQYYRYPFML